MDAAAAQRLADVNEIRELRTRAEKAEAAIERVRDLAGQYTISGAVPRGLLLAALDEED